MLVCLGNANQWCYLRGYPCTCCQSFDESVRENNIGRMKMRMTSTVAFIRYYAEGTVVGDKLRLKYSHNILFQYITQKNKTSRTDNHFGQFLFLPRPNNPFVDRFHANGRRFKPEKEACVKRFLPTH